MERIQDNGPTIDDLFPIDTTLTEEKLEKNLPKTDAMRQAEAPSMRVNLIRQRDAAIAEHLDDYEDFEDPYDSEYPQ